MKGQQGALLPSLPPGCPSCFYKSMPPSEFLRCNSETLPFPIPEGGQEPALNWRSAGSKAGPAGQSGVGPGKGVPAGEISMEDKSLGLPTGQGRVSQGSGPLSGSACRDLAGATGLLGKTKRAPASVL